ncbi:MAG: SpoIIE family protein phosphatase [Acidobacteriota bacterium]|nr:SpoIIE family protein phosphatase [Acidobacteriota bacterium]
MIRAVLVDDEPPARVRMRQLLEAAGGVVVVGEAGSAVEARDVIRDTRPDVLFLDVEMPEVRGTALAAALPEPRPFIVFATAFDSYGLDAIAVDATDYLLKPVSRAKLAATLERVRARLSKQSDLERDVRAGSAVQSHMWPGALPAVPGFDCAAASLPARGVGGDFYDMFALGDDSTLGTLGTLRRWGLLLGDASGKGIAAGLVASAVQARVHTAARLANLAPAALMAAVDRDVYATTDGARYATAIYATLDAASRRLTLVNAGHPAVLVANGSALTRLGASGPALGLTEAGHFTAHDLTLAPGTLLVAYTDGVNEAHDEAGEEFGEDRLAALLSAHGHWPAAELCSCILDTVRHHRGGRQDQDDVTALVVRVL